MRASGSRKVLLIGILALCIHLLLLKSVIDTYFASPIEHGMISVKPTGSPPAKRIVFFVADGLRSQAIFDTEQNLTPFLNSVRESRGSWGVAHTRVPTESRPGHVAIFAGIYEDPSAIFKGWKKNPVDFDSVINQSTNSWSWGSPDIVPMFSMGDKPHIHTYSYDLHMVDFGAKDTTRLDVWVFDEFSKLLQRLNKCADCNEYFSPGSIFFLHLLGIDTAGHAYKPHSKEYSDNIALVDSRIKEAEQLCNEVFNDGLTTYVFTSDHGMTDWGSHGSGLDVETKTPFIAWGAGIKRENVQKDIKQIDIAPLLSALIGVPYPTNSLGRLPYNYLDLPSKKIASMYVANILQLHKIFEAKRIKTSENSLFYIPFNKLLPDQFDSLFFTINKNINETPDFVIEECTKLFSLLIEGIDYYHNYYVNNMLVFVSIGLIGWIVYLSTYFVDDRHCYAFKKDLFVIKLALGTGAGLAIVLCYIQSHPMAYYFYLVFPFGTWMGVLTRQQYLVFMYKSISFLHMQKFSMLMYFITCVTLLIIGFYIRYAYTLVMILMCFWVGLFRKQFPGLDVKDGYSWVFLCATLSIFPLLPSLSTEFHTKLYVGGFLLWHYMIYTAIKNDLMFYQNTGTVQATSQLRLFEMQKTLSYLCFGFALCFHFGYISSESNLKYGCWLLFSLSIGLTFFSMRNIPPRLMSIFMSFTPYYLLMSTSYEILFITFYASLLALWLKIETTKIQLPITIIKFGDASNVSTNRGLEDLRKCLMFMVLILVGFFGTGNIANMNSFDPMWTRCLLTVFRPFIMASLIIVKVLIPFVYSTCVFRAIIVSTKSSLTNLLCGILFFSDIMLFYFFNNIRNVGTWLEIGTSLSHFIIMEVFTLGIIVLYGVAYLLTTAKIA